MEGSSNVLYSATKPAQAAPAKLSKRDKRLLKKRSHPEENRPPKKEEIMDQAAGEEEEEKGESLESSDDDAGALFRPGGKKGKSKVINVDFELVQPHEAYYHSYLDGEEMEGLDVSGLADQVVSLLSIGSVVASSLEDDPAENPKYKDLPDVEFNQVVAKCNGTRDVYGFLTILSLTRRQEQHACLKQILAYVKGKANKHCTDRQKDHSEMQNSFKGNRVGLLLNERLINLPYILVPRLHEGLPEDVTFTRKQDDVEDPREFDYQHLLVITRYSIANPKKGQKPAASEERLYYKAEDELFLKHAEVSFSFKTIFRETLADGTKTSVVGGGAKAPETQYKLIYLIKYKEYEKVVREQLGTFLKQLQ